MNLAHVLDMLRFSEMDTHANMSAAGLCMQAVHADDVVSRLRSYIKSVCCCGGCPSMLTKCCSRIDRCAGVPSQRSGI